MRHFEPICQRRESEVRATSGPAGTSCGFLGVLVPTQISRGASGAWGAAGRPPWVSSKIAGKSSSLGPTDFAEDHS